MLRSRNKGMVVLTTIIMLSILTMLVLSLLQSVFLYTKVSNQVLAKHKALYQLEAAAYHLIADNYAPACLLTLENPNRIIDFLLHKRGCSFIWEDQRYYYLVDDLGLYPCLQTMSDSEVKSSHHWLITVLSSFPQQAVLQLRIAKSVRAIHCDIEHTRQINMGVISWRYVLR